MVGKHVLRAEDNEDLQVISAVLQDAIIRKDEIYFDKPRRCFALLANRFCWECCESERDRRVRTGLHFEGVLSVKARNFDKAEEFLDLLAISFAPKRNGTEDPGGTVTLIFAGDRDIALEVECLEARLKDRTQPWPARMRPHHFGIEAR